MSTSKFLTQLFRDSLHQDESAYPWTKEAALQFNRKVILEWQFRDDYRNIHTVTLPLAALVALQPVFSPRNQMLPTFEFYIDSSWNCWELAAAIGWSGKKVDELETLEVLSEGLTVVPCFFEDLPIWRSVNETLFDADVPVFAELGRAKRHPTDLPRRLRYLPKKERPAIELWNSWVDHWTHYLTLEIVLRRDIGLPPVIVQEIEEYVLIPFADREHMKERPLAFRQVSQHN